MQSMLKLGSASCFWINHYSRTSILEIWLPTKLFSLCWKWKICTNGSNKMTNNIDRRMESQNDWINSKIVCVKCIVYPILHFHTEFSDKKEWKALLFQRIKLWAINTVFLQMYEWESIDQNKYLPKCWSTEPMNFHSNLLCMDSGQSETNPLNGLKWMQTLTGSCIQHFTFYVHSKEAEPSFWMIV